MQRSVRNMKWLVVLALGVVLAGCKSELYTNLSEREANEMVSVLVYQDIAADRVRQADGNYSLRVEESRMADATTVLKAAGHPRRTYNTMGDVFAGNGFVMSPMEEKARLIYALSEELAQTISSMDGILSARVHVVLPERDLMRRSGSPSSASVFVRYRDGLNIAALRPQIKMLVAKSVEGLTYENVSVVPLAVAQQPLSTQVPVAAGGTVQADAGGGVGWWINGVIVLAILGYAAWAIRAFSRSGPAPGPRRMPRRMARRMARRGTTVDRLPRRILALGAR